ncbi:MAG: hypothetical protein K9M97_08740, partial [Akkermansiaceae bacterium]|nr:hypothetical protein [Akkermansiaceae bacterium]
VGRPGRAAAAWRTVGEMNVLYQTIGAHPIDQLGPGGVGEILSLLAAQPVSPKRDEVLKKICQVEVASGRVRALALAADSPDEAVRLTLLESLAEAARTPAHLVAVRSLAGDEPEGKLAVALMDALGRVDPVAAWREAVGLGPDNANARMLADLAMVRLRRTHPEMIPALLAESPQLALINPTCVRDLLIGPARLWPARTFWFARAWLPEESPAVVLPMIATEWARNDSEAACAVCLTLPAGESGRFAAASAALKVWLAKSPDAALKWLGADPARTELLLRNHDLLALAGRERIIPFLTGLPINAQVLESSTIAASELADADYAKAAAFLQTSAVRAREAGIGETQLRSLAQAERAVVTGWLAADPPAASAFIDSLPGPAADPLRSGDSGREFSFRRLAVAKGIPFALGQLPEEDQGRRQAVRGIVAAALGGGGSDGLKAILLAIGKEDGQMGRLRLGQVIAKSYLEYDPDGLLPWLRTLPGTVDHDLLSDAAAVVVSSLRESPWRRQIALAAVRLLAKHPPPGGETAVEPLALRLLFGNKSSPFPTAIAAAHLDGDLPEIPVVKHLDQIVSHLIAGRPAAALPDAAALPSPEFDALLCRILTAIPAAERAAALAALPDSLRPRATAWASVLAGTR